MPKICPAWETGANIEPMKCACQICGGLSNELKRGRCAVCYTQWLVTRPVGLGANCICCGERRVDCLRSVELLGAFVPTCFNCAGRISRLSNVPRTFADLRKVLHRDRRRTDRRHGKKDTRVFQYDRRHAERRSANDNVDADDMMLIDDDMIIEIHELTDELAALSSHTQTGSELTQIRFVSDV